MKLFTSESVTEGHPDKVCDQISDAVLDAIIEQDPAARVACETIVTTGMALVMGEISTEKAYVDIPGIARKTIEGIGYDDPAHGFDARSCAVLTSIDEQSPDIAMGVDRSLEYKSAAADNADLIGAGDQGMMFGFACDETPELMPAAIVYAHALCKELAAARRSGDLPYLRPDGKAQVTVQYGENGAVERIHTVVVSSQHSAEVDIETLRKEIRERVAETALPKNLIDNDTLFYINPTGRFVVGGPQGDSGLTGRKIIVDTYGGYARHGGGAFSGKDPTKVDRSAAYMARYAAKNLVAAGLCRRCEIELAYAIGVARPVSVLVDSFGTGTISDELLGNAVREVFDLRPAEIIKALDLRRPIYKAIASYGHFGRGGLPWENTDRTEALVSVTQ
ncbi:MAG: methionine adenosyltransferase [Oscillospiraceae bacterium]|jgi:S-adenosylmethionine synthetase|nr:methionine adenosyltransferase [Oscillospiraceae bacterium]